jgi:hypothetical protein
MITSNMHGVDLRGLLQAAGITHAAVSAPYLFPKFIDRER